MKTSALQVERAAYQPKLPKALQGAIIKNYNYINYIALKR